MSAINSALTRIAAIQAGLSITLPVAVSTKRAYRYPPSRDKALTDFPCWINMPRLVRVEPHIGLLVRWYTVRMQVFVQEADLDRGAEIAQELVEAAIVEFTKPSNLDLNGNVTNTSIRGADPTIGMLEWAGHGYPGGDLLLDVEIKSSVN